MLGFYERAMYSLAEKYANKMNGSSGNKELDEIRSKANVPRNVMDAGSYLGFVVGFTVCYRLLAGVNHNDDDAETGSG